MRKVLVPIILISFIMILVSCATTPSGPPPGPPIIRATGYGALPPPRPGGNPAQARLMAQRAAQVDAYRNLAERIKGVHIEGETTVRDFIATNDMIRTRVDAIIRGARVISSRELPDKTFEVEIEVRIAEIRAACKGY
ncbi:MAG: LPP20 family lipoprotein [bacterium]|nr:LPP20 family lipoprotein [bacterium]